MEVKEIKKEKNTKTKELPLKVETEMIYSLLNGIKTQFRKPIKEGEAFLSKYKKNDILYVKEGWGFYYDKLIYRSDLSILRDTLSPEHYEDLMKKTNWKTIHGKTHSKVTHGSQQKNVVCRTHLLACRDQGHVYYPEPFF